MPDDGKGSSTLHSWLTGELLPPVGDRAQEVRTGLLRPFFEFLDGHQKPGRPFPLAGEGSVTLKEPRESRHPKYLRAFEREPLGRSHPDWYQHWFEARPLARENVESALSEGDWDLAIHESGERVDRDLFTALWILSQQSGKGAHEEQLLLLQRLHEWLRHRADTVKADDGANEQGDVSALRRNLRRVQRDLAEEQESTAQMAAGLEAAKVDADGLRQQNANLRDRLKKSTDDRGARDARIVALGSEKLELSAQLDSVNEGRKAVADQRDGLDARLQATARRSLTKTRLAAAREQENADLREQFESAPHGLAGARELLQAEHERAEQESAIAQGGQQRAADIRARDLKKLIKLSDELFPALAPASSHGYGAPIDRAELRLLTLGGGDSIGASSHVLELGSFEQRFRVMVDCGLRVKAQIDEMGPKLDPANPPDAVIVTHAHVDHCGWLPALVHDGYDGPIYCTPETKELIGIMLDDSLQNLRIKMGQLRLQARYASGEPVPEPYTAADLEATLAQIREVPFDAEIDLGIDLRFRLIRAGHILGAAMVIIEGRGRRVLFTGDFSTESFETVYPAVTREVPEELDLLVSESTYGDSQHRPRADLVADFERGIDAVLGQGGSVLNPELRSRQGSRGSPDPAARLRPWPFAGR